MRREARGAAASVNPAGRYDSPAMRWNCTISGSVASLSNRAPTFGCRLVHPPCLYIAKIRRTTHAELIDNAAKVHGTIGCLAGARGQRFVQYISNSSNRHSMLLLKNVRSLAGLRPTLLNSFGLPVNTNPV